MRHQLETVLSSALSFNQAHQNPYVNQAHQKRPRSNDVLLLDNRRSIEEDLCLVLDDGAASHLASPRAAVAVSSIDAKSEIALEST